MLLRFGLRTDNTTKVASLSDTGDGFRASERWRLVLCGENSGFGNHFPDFSGKATYMSSHPSMNALSFQKTTRIQIAIIDNHDNTDIPCQGWTFRMK